jgi:hypothetical protein
MGRDWGDIFSDSRDEDNVDEDDYYFDFIKWETDKAWLVVMDGKELWFPKSQCSINTKKKIIIIPDWLATEKELT